MSLLALDLGTTTGFAWSAANGVILSGTWDCRPKKYEGAGMRLRTLWENLVCLHNSVRIEKIVFEAVRRHLGTDAAHVYGGMMGTMQLFCEEQHIPYQGIPVGTIKKFWTGNGAAKKDMMIAEARKRGYEPIDDNEADALALLHYELAGTK
jgi:Holliday junction resolvasome RuvABC endonuclease subunit